MAVKLTVLFSQSTVHQLMDFMFRFFHQNVQPFTQICSDHMHQTKSSDDSAFTHIEFGGVEKYELHLEY